MPKTRTICCPACGRDAASGVLLCTTCRGLVAVEDRGRPRLPILAAPVEPDHETREAEKSATVAALYHGDSARDDL